jgi:hypothetical protein
MGKHSVKILVAALVVLLLVVVAHLWARRQHVESPDELAQLALKDGDPAEQEKAAIRLEALAGKLPKTGTRNEAQPHLARVLAESKNPGVRAAAMRGLAGIWDYECVPAMLDALDDESPQVRRAAAGALEALIQAEHTFDAGGNPEGRKAAAQRLRGMWNTFKIRNLKIWQKRLEDKDAK